MRLKRLGAVENASVTPVYQYVRQSLCFDSSNGGATAGRRPHPSNLDPTNQRCKSAGSTAGPRHRSSYRYSTVGLYSNAIRLSVHHTVIYPMRSKRLRAVENPSVTLCTSVGPYVQMSQTGATALIHPTHQRYKSENITNSQNIKANNNQQPFSVVENENSIEDNILLPQEQRLKHHQTNQHDT
jgi:hypothetical protein